jgi:uncharacterized membrane protein
MAVTRSAFVVLSLWALVVLLVIVGVVAAVGRAVYRADFATRMEPVRERTLVALRRQDPFLAQRPAELKRFDERYAAHPVAALLHIVPGGILLVLAPLQFVSRIRNRYLSYHRWSGRILILAAFVSTMAGAYFGLLMPYGGPGEAAVIALFGGLFLAALTRAYVAIRRRQVESHREWMIRAFAIAIGISTVRVVSAVFDAAFTPAGLSPRDLFVLSLLTGWTVTLGAGELWIRYSRTRIGPLLPQDVRLSRTACDLH